MRESNIFTTEAQKTEFWLTASTDLIEEDEKEVVLLTNIEIIEDFSIETEIPSNLAGISWKILKHHANIPNTFSMTGRALDNR